MTTHALNTYPDLICKCMFFINTINGNMATFHAGIVLKFVFLRFSSAAAYNFSLKVLGAFKLPIMADKIILDYHNSLLRQSDLLLLEPMQWLNDGIVGFWFEYLENDLFGDRDDICFISPEVAHFIKLGSSQDSCAFLEPLNLNSKSLVLLPVNNSVSPDTPGGSHWSLLVYERKHQQFYHLDSVHQSNRAHAKSMVSKLALLPNDGKVIELPCTQQLNGWDCGILVCCHAELVLNHHPASIKLLPLLPQSSASSQRSRMLQIISNLAAKNIKISPL